MKMEMQTDIIQQVLAVVRPMTTNTQIGPPPPSHLYQHQPAGMPMGHSMPTVMNPMPSWMNVTGAMHGNPAMMGPMLIR